MDIDSAIVTDLDNKTTSYTAGQEPWNKNLDGFNIEKIGTESQSYTPDWEKWNGIYKTIPELKAEIDTFCRWVIGRKLTMDSATEETGNRIKGNGKDSLRKILMNQKRVSKICGDSFAEKVKDKAKRLINLKPLDPKTIRIEANSKGIIKRYVQIIDKNKPANQNKKDPNIIAEWKPNEIFHLANNKIADEIHGIPETESLLKIIKWRHQVMNAYSVILQRYMKPTYFYETDTDDETEILGIKTKIDNAVTNFENVVLPKGTLAEVKNVRTAQQATLDPMPWMNFLKKYFVLTSGTPDIVLGESRESAVSSGELNFISYKERVIQEQFDYSEEIKAQLGLTIKFEEPREIAIESANNLGFNSNKRKQKIETKSKGKIANA